MSYSDTVGRVLSGEFDDASAEDKVRAVRELITVCSTAAGAVAIQPVPLLDVVLITPIQIALVQGIGRIHGHHLDRRSVLEILGTFGASLVSQNILLATAKLVPVAGWLAGAAMAYAMTWAIGEVAQHYFSTGRGVGSDDLRTMFRKVYADKKEEALKRAPSLKERLEQLAEARAAGLLDEAEFERKKQEILSAL